MFKVELLIFVITFSPPLQMLAQPLAAGVGGRARRSKNCQATALDKRGVVGQGFGCESVSKMWRPLNLSCDHMYFFLRVFRTRRPSLAAAGSN